MAEIRKGGIGMEEGIAMYMNKNGEFDLYDDTYDLTIHCVSKEEQDKAIERINSCRWIPTSEKMPDADEYILVSFENFTIPMIGRYTVDDDDNGTFRIGDEDESFAENDLYVNAWMPLPKPYRESEE